MNSVVKKGRLILKITLVILYPIFARVKRRVG